MFVLASPAPPVLPEQTAVVAWLGSGGQQRAPLSPESDLQTSPVEQSLSPLFVSQDSPSF
jgi:hypothetical protein